MSLYKQLWIAIALLMAVVFGITFTINGVSSSRYLEQQLSIKNQDEATALALSLSQQQADPVVIELQLAAKLDQGAYEYIEFRNPTGQVLFSRGSLPMESQAPDWLKGLFPIYSHPGVAEVTNGWNQLGELTLKSNDSFAYDELWAGGKRTLIALVLAIVVSGVAGSLLLRIILRPLNQVVGQAQAIGQRRFISLPEPFTTEFAEVTRSMNELARRVREMLNRESERLTRQREASDLDPTTGILRREPFMGRLRAKLESEGADATGSIALVRIADLARLNQLYGHQSMDTVLKSIGNSLRRLSTSEIEWFAGRLNGSDFCLLAPQEDHPVKVGEILQRLMRQVLEEHAMAEKTTLPAACAEYASGQSTGQVMTSLDGALLAAAEQDGSPIVPASKGSGVVLPVREQAAFWKAELTAVLNDNRLLIETYPVLDAQGQLIHEEGMARIRADDAIRGAGEFMPWVHRLDMGSEVDRAVIQLALSRIGKNRKPVCINLTASSLTDGSFATWLESTLMEQPDNASQLSVEVAEAAAYTHAEGLRRLTQRVHAYGVQVGIEHMGYRISDIGKLGELGVNYLKIDGLFVRGVDSNQGNEAVFRTYAGIAQSLGLECIAEGVSNNLELQAVFNLGATGASGPGVKLDS